MSTAIETTSRLGTVATLRRGLELSPEIRQGIWVTLALAAVTVLAAANEASISKATGSSPCAATRWLVSDQPSMLDGSGPAGTSRQRCWP